MIKKISLLVLALLLVLSFVSCDTAGGDETTESSSADTSEEPIPPAESSNGDDSSDGNETDPPPTREEIEPSVGYYEEESDGVSVRVDFWDVPRPWFENRIEGTLTYTNNTGEELSRYLHAGIDIFGDHYYPDELTHSDTPEIVQSEEYETLTAEAPLLLNLGPGETVTVSFSVAIPSQYDLPDCTHFLIFGLSENEVFHFRETSYRLCFRVY